MVDKAFNNKFPKFFYAGEQVLEINKCEPEALTREIDDDRVEVISRVDPKIADEELKRLKDSSAAFISVMADNDSIICKVTDEFSDEELNVLKEKLSAPIWDVKEFEPTGEMIVHVDRFQAEGIIDLLRKLECMANKPFKEGGTIEEALDKDAQRKRLDDVIAEAQKFVEKQSRGRR